jgi:hypothetical protein
LPRFYVKNRRDGSRLLSSAVVISCIGLVGQAHPLGRFVALLGGAISIYWWFCYTQLKA